jgi:stringent starvation protein B
MNHSDIESPSLTSTKPYLLRAFYDWIVDNQCDPYIIVNTDIKDVVVPTDYIHDGRIVLNIAMRAINHLKISNEYISFDARFSGILKEIFIPLEAILAIYANENGHGMVFSNVDASMDQSSEFSINESSRASSSFEEIGKDKSTFKQTALKGSQVSGKLSVVKKPKTKGDGSHLRLVK